MEDIVDMFSAHDKWDCDRARRDGNDRRWLDNIELADPAYKPTNKKWYELEEETLQESIVREEYK